MPLRACSLQRSDRNGSHPGTYRDTKKKVQALSLYIYIYRISVKSLARPGRKQSQKNVRYAVDFNDIETGAVIRLFFLQGKALKEIHAILKETLACFLPGRAKD